MDRAVGLITRRMLAATERASARLAGIEADLEDAAQENVLAPLAAPATRRRCGRTWTCPASARSLGR